MAKVDVYNLKREKVGELELAATRGESRTFDGHAIGSVLAVEGETIALTAFPAR